MLIKWIFLPFVFSRECRESNGQYTGRKSTTVSGKTCQKWNRNYPHKTKYRPNPDNHNYCRNPDNDAKGPWCYTTDRRTRFEYCNVPNCPAKPAPTRPTATRPAKDCFSSAGTYDGNASKTVTGRACQRWNSNVPHSPKFRIGNHNYCRAPDGDSKVWCYTMDPNKRWEYCGVEKCPTTGGGSGGGTGGGVGGNTGTCGIPRFEPEFDNFAAPSVVDKNGDPPPGDSSNGLDIYGGSDALPQRLPWQIYLRGPYGCGGTLVSLKTVVTAVHCVVGTSASDWSISAGHIKKDDRDARREVGYQRIRVRQLIQHPSYSASTNDQDIAIMVLERPFKYTKFVRPACLPKANFKIFDGAAAIISGWGMTERGAATRLKQNVIPMHSHRVCNANLYGRVTQHMICGGKRNEDTCQGDSGGPLITIIDDEISGEKKYTLFGVTSWGYGCGKQGKPGVYVEVADYINFIKRYI